VKTCKIFSIFEPLGFIFHVTYYRNKEEEKNRYENVNNNVVESVMLQVLTKDSVTVSVDAVVYYRVCNATISVANVANAHHSTRLLAQTTLRNVLGTRPLHEILSDREAISNTMQVRIYQSTLILKFRLFLIEVMIGRSHWTKPLNPGESK